MRSKPPFHPQETPDSCVPACLRMVLASLSVVISEQELRQRCDCTIFGTEAFQAVEAARQIGLVHTRKENLTLLQLRSLVEKKTYPIVYVELMPIDQIRGIHALVVTDIIEEQISVLDPLRGERQLEQKIFEDAFRLTNGLTIIVS